MINNENEEFNDAIKEEWLYSETLKTDATNFSSDEWYLNAKQYWSEVPATVDGVLGGFGSISRIDICDSRKFLRQLFRLKNPPEKERALDCGAGIGRITTMLLSKFFKKIDLVEQNSAFLDEFKTNLLPDLVPKIDGLFCEGLQNFKPKDAFYDIIWIQWVLGHLTDAHFIRFLRDCGKALRKNGLVVVKENITSSGQVELDEQDSSVTRPLWLLKILFAKSGFKTVYSQKQEDFPKGLYSVYMFALQYVEPT